MISTTTDNHGSNQYTTIRTEYSNGDVDSTMIHYESRVIETNHYDGKTGKSTWSPGRNF